MTDIVEQLRNPALKGFYLRTEAADEIERLQAEAEQRLDTNGRMRVELANAQAEIERLQALVRTCPLCSELEEQLREGAEK
jgi:hypothetical protein